MLQPQAGAITVTDAQSEKGALVTFRQFLKFPSSQASGSVNKRKRFLEDSFGSACPSRKTGDEETV